MYRLTSRQAAFVRRVAQGRSATEAARLAGYSASYANRQAAQLLDNPRVQSALAKLTASIAAPEIALAAHRQTWWTTIMRDNGQEMKDRLRASELLGRAQGDFVERHEHTGKDGEPLPPAQVIVYEIPDNGRVVPILTPPVSRPAKNGSGRHR